MDSKLSSAARTLTPSPIQQLSHLAERIGAINLAEGFPDFPAPPEIKAAAVSAINSDLNQYIVTIPGEGSRGGGSSQNPSNVELAEQVKSLQAQMAAQQAQMAAQAAQFQEYMRQNSYRGPPSRGGSNSGDDPYDPSTTQHVQGICELLESKLKRDHGLEINPLTDVVICCGQTEAFMAAIFAVIDHGDEVILFDPAYETYGTCISLVGGIPVYVPLDPPFWTFDVETLTKSFTNRTKVVVLNSPHNPTGKVFTKGELEAIAGACCSRDCFCITDEVYEYITFDQHKHISIASLPGMQERTIITSSLSKTFSVTGWRVGWACAPSNIASAIRNVHIKIVDSAPAPFQFAALTALRSSPEYFKSLKTSYEARRDYTVEILSGLGFQIQFKPQGSFFIFAELPESWLYSDVDFVRDLIEKGGVAAVPGCGFFHNSSNGVSKYYSRFVRFAFCKSDETLGAAAQRIREVQLMRGEGLLKKI